MAAGMLALLTTGCHALRDEGWREVKSQHFVLSTDAPSGRARARLETLEAQYAALQGAWFTYSKRLNTTMRVVQLDGESDLEVLGHARFAGVVSTPRMFGEPPTVVLASGAFEFEGRRLATHELSHRFAAFYYPTIPFWLNEGLAEYLETMQVRPGAAVFGEHTAVDDGVQVYALPSVARVPSLEELLAMDEQGFYLQHDSSRSAKKQLYANYTGAWALVHALFDENPRGFADYLDALYQGRIGEREAWSELTLTTNLRNVAQRQQTLLLDTGGVGIMTQRYQPPPGPRVEERNLSRSEVNARLSWVHSDDTKRDRRQLFDLANRAVALNGSSPEALRARARADLLVGDGPGAYQDLQAALRHSGYQPAHAMALVEFFMAQSQLDSASRATLERLLELLIDHGQSAPELEIAARYLARQGQYRAARTVIHRATLRDPSCYRCLRTFASISAALGLPRQAVLLQSTAINLTPDADRDAELFTELLHYRKLAAAEGETR